MTTRTLFSLASGTLGLLLALASALARPAATRPQESGAAERSDAPLAGMDWLAGSWSGDMWGGRFHAYYSSPAGGKIIGYSRLLRGEQESYYEFEVFEEREPLVHLQPFPRGTKAVGLVLTELDAEARRATFENPDKDYPTRIVYERVSDEELLISLSDPHGESGKSERFELRR